MKTIKPSEASAARLQPLIEYVHGQKYNSGAINELAKMLSDRTGQKIHRQYVGLWLNPDPAFRVEPRLGIGLLLIEAGEKLIKRDRAPKTPIKTA